MALSNRDALSMARDLEALDLDDIAAELRRLHALTQGTPATGGEPVASQIAAPFPGMNTPWTEEQKQGLQAALAEVFGWNAATSPQPVREPLSPERVREIAREAGYDTGPFGHRADFINGLRHGERAHGITGGQT